MINKKNFVLGIILVIFLIWTVSAQGVSYCCEKTIAGAWCQNSPEENCDSEYRKVPTSCEATSYCQLGCCYNSQEGTCMENTPQKVCEEPEEDISGGVWEDNAECEIPQCELGCCLIGDQAAFVTQTRCKRLASVYGLEINFRTDIENEIQCIASATSDVKGACVFAEEYKTTCLFLTKAKCQEMETGDSEAKFHEGYLCSAEALGTNCGPTEQTTCVEGIDEVYFVDSCGNLANIYDSSKIENKEYWSKIYGKSESCNAGSSNADSATCGNCDYYLGSTCKTYKRGEDKVKPNYGDNICRDLSCKYEGESYSHGETWCADVKGVSKITVNSETGITKITGQDLPGGRYFRLVCYNGDVSVEPCADFRQEICLESDIDGFKTAGCRVSMWQDCASQDNEKNCENTDRRDCEWVNERCIPLYSPGFNFWETEGDAESLCSMASTECVVKYEKKLGGDKKCVENCHCLGAGWEEEMNEMCNLIGDCGSKKNYLGFEGY